MFVRVANRILGVAVAAALILVVVPAKSYADAIVLPGWSLFTTAPGDSFFRFETSPGVTMSIPLQGVPVDTHDFDGVGVRNTFRTDTIVRRLSAVSPLSGTTNLAMEALQLRSVDQVPLLGDYMYLTLQSIRGGPASTGSMLINFDGETIPSGSFEVTLDVFFDIRVGALNGRRIGSGNDTFTASGFWNDSVPPKGVRISDVNVFPEGTNGTGNIFTIGLVDHDSGEGKHIVAPAVTPEPASLLLVGSGLLGIAARARRRARKTPNA